MQKDKVKFLEGIDYVPFPATQYYRREEAKKQIVLHHTVSGDGIEGDLAWWLHTPERIATAFIISRDGKIHQNFSSKYWAHHLGVKSKVFKKYGIESGGTNAWLNIRSIGVELDSWGGLKDSSKVKHVVKYPQGYRGYEYFEAYTEAQLESLKDLLQYLCDKYKIPSDYNENMWDVSKDALEGKSGIWTHASYRPDKSDCHPQESLIKTLKSL